MIETVFDLMVAQQVYALSLGDYAPIREAYRLAIWGAVNEYLTTQNVRVTRFKNGLKREMLAGFTDAFNQGYGDGGGDIAEMLPEDGQWLTAKMNAEIGYIDSLFVALKELKAEAKEDPTATAGEADRRATGYTNTLDGVYAEGKLRGAGNKMLTFGGQDGNESCATCQRLKGARHGARWWVRHHLIPGQPGNDNYKCGGYQCEHFLYDDNGSLFVF